MKALVSKAAIKVAAVPKTISNGLKDAILDIRQPIVRPGIAAGVNIGNTVKASEKRNCMGP